MECPTIVSLYFVQKLFSSYVWCKSGACIDATCTRKVEQYPEHYTTYQVYIIPGYECKVLKKEQQKALLSSTIPVIVIEIFALHSSSVQLKPRSLTGGRKKPEKRPLA